MAIHWVYRLRNFMRSAIWFLMMIAAVLTMINLYLYPLLEITTLHYRPRTVGCDGARCVIEEPCIINGTVLGKDFENVVNHYTLPFGAIVSSIHFLLLMRIFGSRFIKSTFPFFCLAVLPARFIFFIMQTLEFKSVGGEAYSQLLYAPKNYQCNMFSGFLDAVSLFHIRFFFLIADFVTLHMLIVTVPLYYIDDGSQSYHLYDEMEQKADSLLPVTHSV